MTTHSKKLYDPFRNIGLTLKNILISIGACWLNIRAWYKLLQPAVICLLASLLLPLLFSFNEQGQDILRLVASEGINAHMFWMFAGMLMAGFASWGWARFLLNYEFPVSEEVSHISYKQAERGRLIVRRTCGLAPPLGMAMAFLIVAPHSGLFDNCLILALVSSFVAAVLWFSFEPLSQLHRKINRIPHKVKKRFTNLKDINDDNFTKCSIVITWVIAAAAFISFTCAPVRCGEALGSAAVILFAVAIWICIGSFFIYIANLYRVPLLSMLFFWAVICSFSNDNHKVRTLPHVQNAKAPLSIVDALDRWYSQVTNNYPQVNNGRKRPLYLVAAAGGGIRAAYWTAIVLGKLEDSARSRGSSFAAHTFIMSGVSGGSLGEITFAALQVHGPKDETNFMGDSRGLLNQDFLAADLSRMAFADLLQRFLPFPNKHFDRAQSLEEAWETAWKDEFHTNVLVESLTQLYADAENANIILPHVLLNGTCVETGQRIITSDLKIRSEIKAMGLTNSAGDFLDVIDAADELRQAPIRLSTAVDQSARFTYFSPAGLFPDGRHVVDGGYFENSGATTLLDALRVIQSHIYQKKWTNVEPRIILINNDPIAVNSESYNSEFMGESLSPVRALLNTRAARGDYAVEQALHSSWSLTNVYQFDLYQLPNGQPIGTCKDPTPLPLGWTLSQNAMDEMDAQLTVQSNELINPAIVSKIIADLPQRRRLR